MQNAPTHFFAKLREYQQDHGMTRRLMEESIGVSSPAFNNWKNGAIPRPETCDQIARALGLSRNEVRSWANHPLVGEPTTASNSDSELASPPTNSDELAAMRQRLQLLESPALREAAMRLITNTLDQFVALQAVLHTARA